MNGFAKCEVCGLCSVQQGLLSEQLIKHHQALYCVLWNILCRCFSLSSERDKNFYAPALVFFARAYLAVKADDLCTVFTLEFMCYCDKAGGVVCVSV